MEKIYMFKKFRAAREMLTLRLPTTDWASSKPLSWEEEEEFTFFIVIPLILFSPSSLISLAKYSYLFLSTCRRFFSLLFMCKHEQLHRHMYFFFKLATTIVRDRWNWIWIFNCCYIILFIPFFLTHTALPESVRDLRTRPPTRTKMEDLTARPPVQVQARERWNAVRIAGPTQWSVAEPRCLQCL